jgi:hypothetical protein
VLLVVFSRDRALQLHALLSSLRLHCRDVEDAQVAIIYRASNTRHRRQYQQLEHEFPAEPPTTFVPERSFRRDLLSTLLSGPERAAAVPLRHVAAVVTRLSFLRSFSRIIGSGASDFVCFLVDDTMFVADFTLAEVRASLEARQTALGFSLRLGTNTKYSYTRDTVQSLPPFQPVSHRVLAFRWDDAAHNFAYPLEVSSSVYRLGQLLPTLLRVRFRNPNTLESALAAAADGFAPDHDELLCFRQSVAFSNPVNKVQNDYDNRSAGTSAYTAESLADLFDRGERIDVIRYSGLIPEGPHYEVPLEFVGR